MPHRYWLGVLGGKKVLRGFLHETGSRYSHQLGAQQGLLVGDLHTSLLGFFSRIIGLPYNVAAGAQGGMFQQVKTEDALLLHSFCYVPWLQLLTKLVQI